MFDRSSSQGSKVILNVEDDPDDQWMNAEALQEADPQSEIHFVGDGNELMDYLHHQGKYSDPEGNPRPALILLDLNMPCKDGREALAELKSDPEFRRIPVVVLTTSTSSEDIQNTYQLGANGYITKPARMSELVEIMRVLKRYWLRMVELPTT